jgi:hypothetical protein
MKMSFSGLAIPRLDSFIFYPSRINVESILHQPIYSLSQQKLAQQIASTYGTLGW